MRILVTGASGFMGAHFCRIARQKHTLLGLYCTTPLRIGGVHALRGDLCKPPDVSRLKTLNVDTVVHFACRIKAPAGPNCTPGEAARIMNQKMMSSVLSLGKPVVYASSTVVHWERETPYGESRKGDEAALVKSGLPYAILRPSAPFGPPLLHHKPGHQESFFTLVRLIQRLPLIPMVGDGTYRRQPIHVEDFSGAILSLLDQGLPNLAMDAGGAAPLPFWEIIDTISRGLGLRRRRLPLPQRLFTEVARFHPQFEPELIQAMVEDEVADNTLLIAETGIQPRSFSAGLADLLQVANV